ncbi:E3 SUMO-protein ligase KIAA1586-like [Homalodisca vitripennis]|uniref:E3 SUMO-protein ligase KIAA1586-like n=1 Tax=Homalodisca vitripennis TaxID=197043 RepID=UPI001EE9F075|nr:E3 SUMO-protein ligase KIAA1586-like [Homalodisca vitripennis]
MSSSEDDVPSSKSVRPSIIKHKQQKYRSQWENDDRFKKWLEADKTNAFKAHCRLCNVSMNAELIVLKNHDKSKKHQELMLNLKHKSQPKITALGFVKKMPQNVKSQTVEIKLAGFFAEHNISFNVADHLIHLLKKLIDYSETLKNISLKRTKCNAVVRNVIGNTFKEQLIEKLKETKFSILIDESTDISMIKTIRPAGLSGGRTNRGPNLRESTVVRFFDKLQGKVVSNFFELKSVFDSSTPAAAEGGATAEHLYSILEDTLKSHNIPKDNVIGFASDGCNTMMGVNNSVASRLKENFPGIFILKCVCHSLHLCASEACKKLPKELEDLIRGVFNFMHGSAKRLSLFQQFQKFLDLDLHRILHPSQTRWLSVMAAVERVLEQWNALELFFIDILANDNSRHAEEICTWLHDPFMKIGCVCRSVTASGDYQLSASVGEVGRGRGAESCRASHPPGLPAARGLLPM